MDMNKNHPRTSSAPWDFDHIPQHQQVFVDHHDQQQQTALNLFQYSASVTEVPFFQSHAAVLDHSRTTTTTTTALPIDHARQQRQGSNIIDQNKQQHDQEIMEEEEELGAVKEMIYRIAAMQPVDIDPATIKKPKRRNVRISDDPQSIAARHRREKISERIRILQRLVPGGTKMDTASMLDEAIRYVKFLKRQVNELQNNQHTSVGSTPPPPFPAMDWTAAAAAAMQNAAGLNYQHGPSSSSSSSSVRAHHHVLGFGFNCNTTEGPGTDHLRRN